MDDKSTPSASASATTYPTLAVDEARSRAKTTASDLYDMIALPKAKVTQRGPAISPCDEDPTHLYKTRHPWSVYGVSEAELKAGFERLHQALPKQGWKVVSYGEENSEAKSLSLTADSGKDRFSVNAVLIVSTPTNPHEKEPLIAVTVVSGCWRAPKGTDLSAEY
ncbi:hypothetical protein [Streptomyces acidiscabies]|uniref:Uncharacterized protein n=1 Tax=Streptomyces acidiscabies TaxID=42234 RepID=A0A0L0K100_9ACTN|nr:hypothetical protein [Streptomyces acidiscabies]KND31434.1 hypothetical protein IQ63_26690 [Streptomyces acidiscabies]